jgi:hypothetical protein
MFRRYISSARLGFSLRPKASFNLTLPWRQNHMKRSQFAAQLCVFFLLLPAGTAFAQTTRNKEMRPTGKGWGEPVTIDQSKSITKPRGKACIGCVSTGNGINYNGGPVMSGTVNIYYIWYGTWDGSGGNGTNPVSDSPGTQSLLNNLIIGLSGSPYENINTTYTDQFGGAVSGFLNLGASTSDFYSLGTSLSDADIQSIVASHAGVDLPLDSNGIYIVNTSSDVNETSGFCTAYCGWHTSALINGLDLKYSFVGNADRCPFACEAQQTSPNNNSGADGMASIIAHETEEAISDPDLNAWFDSSGQENADKCAWTFGSTFIEPNGSSANMNLNGVDYLIQQNWVNASGGFCALSF